MTIREVLINIRERLQNAGIEDFEYESWAFLDWKLHIDRAEFYMNPNGEVKEELLAELESVLKQREQRTSADSETGYGMSGGTGGGRYSE